VCDWWVRRFTDRHVTLPVLKNIPLPAWSDEDRRAVARVVSTLLVRGGTIRLPGGVALVADPALQKLEDVDLRVAVEKQVLRGFGLGHQDFQAVLADFSDNACPAIFLAKLRSQPI
jgi:hypothetical protein